MAPLSLFLTLMPFAHYLRDFLIMAEAKKPSGLCMGFPSGSALKNLPAVQETQVQSLGQEDPLEEEMATHSSILARKIPWTEEPGGYISNILSNSFEILLTSRRIMDH